MDKIWDITIDFLAKINAWIPLVSILWAGAGLVGIVLILAITGCALRKRLVPQWLIWGYFIFAAIIIFAQANNDIFTVVAYIEIPFLIVLVCYFLRVLFYRRPRYTYVERTVQVREVSKKPAAKNVKKEVAVVSQIQTSALDEEDDEDDNQVNIDETIAEVKAEASEENTIAEVVADKAEVAEESVVDFVTENVETEEAKEEVNVAEVETANDVATEEENIVEPVKVAEPVTTDLPVVEPIVEKTYEAPRPTMTTTTATTAATAARPTTATSTFGRTNLGTGSLFGSRSASSTSTTATTTTPRSTLNTKTTATTARPTLSSYSSMLGARKPAATSATSTTNTVRPTSSVGTNTTAKPRSTDDIMAAIERLRASMKKN